MTVEWLKKNLPNSTKELRRWIDPKHSGLSVVGQCQLIGLPRSSWYYASSRKQSGESEENLALMRSIDELYLKHPFYGSRKMAFELDANRKRAGRLMRRLMGIEAIYPKRRTTQRNKNHKIYPYLLRPGFILQRGDYPMRLGLEYRHHVHPDAARLRVLGSRDGLVQPLRAVVAADSPLRG